MAQPLCRFKPLIVSPKMKWLKPKKQLSHFQEFAILKYSVFTPFWEKVEPLWETGYYKWLKVAQRLSNATIYPGRPPIRQLPHHNRNQSPRSRQGDGAEEQVRDGGELRPSPRSERFDHRFQASPRRRGCRSSRSGGWPWRRGSGERAQSARGECSISRTRG